MAYFFSTTKKFQWTRVLRYNYSELPNTKLKNGVTLWKRNKYRIYSLY